MGPQLISKERQRLSVLCLHHFFYPDDAVSSRHFSDFAEELSKRNWDVTVLTSNRYTFYPKKKISPSTEFWHGVKVIRSYRPGWDQANKYLRLASCLWIMLSWVLRLRKIPAVDVVIVGSNPHFAALLFPFLRFFKSGKLLVHWCYDLYPEAIIADGAEGLVKRLLYKFIAVMKWAYKSVDIMVDIGSCMRQRLAAYDHQAHSATLVPWAFVELDDLEEPDPLTRFELFGDADLALLYSGSLGKAHDFSLILSLARKLINRDPRVIFCFAGRGSRFNELREAIRPEDINIRIAPFVEKSKLGKRLNAADIHLLSLQPEWQGIVVPSKFFSSLAVGKPIIYVGPETSCIGKWIRQLNLGLVLTEKNVDAVADELLDISRNKERVRKWSENALSNYKLFFSKKIIMDQWDTLLREHYNNLSS
jgi:colanic acid biosynthesis glycosyl transferase WcaI